MSIKSKLKITLASETCRGYELENPEIPKTWSLSSQPVISYDGTTINSGE